MLPGDLTPVVSLVEKSVVQTVAAAEVVVVLLDVVVLHLLAVVVPVNTPLARMTAVSVTTNVVTVAEIAPEAPKIGSSTLAVPKQNFY